MNDLSTADVVEHMLTLGELAGLQYQYWLAVTFATIVAAFVGRTAIPMRFKIAVAIMYLMASLLFLLVYLNLMDAYYLYATEALARGAMSESSSGPAVPLMRFSIWAVGAGLTIWFIFQSEVRGDA